MSKYFKYFKYRCRTNVKVNTSNVDVELLSENAIHKMLSLKTTFIRKIIQNLISFPFNMYIGTTIFARQYLQKNVKYVKYGIGVIFRVFSNAGNLD